MFRLEFGSSDRPADFPRPKSDCSRPLNDCSRPLNDFPRPKNDRLRPLRRGPDFAKYLSPIETSHLSAGDFFSFSVGSFRETASPAPRRTDPKWSQFPGSTDT